MKYIFFSLCLIVGFQVLYAQKGSVVDHKPGIDSIAVKSWPKLGNEPIISDDGNYISYIIYNMPAKGSTVFVQSTNSGWKKEIIRGIPIAFTENSKQFICQVKDTLQFITLGKNESFFVNRVDSWKQPDESDGKWLAWQVKDTLVLRNLLTGKDKLFYGIKDYNFNSKGNVLVLKNTAGQLVWFNLEKLTTSIVWLPDNINVLLAYAVDKRGTQLAFVLQSKSDRFKNAIWYYKPEFKKATLKANNETRGGNDGLFFGSAVRFSNDGRYIYTLLQRPPNPVPDPGYVKLDVWSYTDTILQSSQLMEGKKIDPGKYEAVINVATNNLVKVCQNLGDFLKLMPEDAGDFVLVSNNNKGDRFWLNERDSNWLVSLKNSERIPLQIKDRVPFWFSPDGTFLVYYDLDKHHYFSYDLLLRKLTNITSALEPGILDRKYEYIHPYNNSAADLVKTCVGIADWLMEAKKMLVYDDYDVWLLDLTGRQSPVNLTNGYGREHNIKFRLFSKLGLDKRPLLTAFNTLNKENGFFRMSLDGKADPELLVMEAKTYFHSPIEVMNPEELDNGMRPLKARKADKWLVKKQSAEEAPNFFVTSDFKNYKPLTFIFPEKNYSWVKSKLINWKLSDHEQTQGILYVPENFDSTKKYPVIFQIYEQYSHRLFEYPTPGFSTDFVNIPWCVSKGYLIFMPDIHFNIGEIGRSALTTVVTAVKALSDLPFVDTSRLALMGHSYSGQMVYHIITHTNFFAAAVASAGVSDQVSGSLQLTGYGLEKKDSRLQNAEIRLGASLWERPDLYLAETPVLHAHKVTTPIVILHSITDGLPWEQAVEMFISLRRNGKRAWMLQYENSGHSLAGKDAVDYTYRIFQFFDHYLSSAPAPRWMTSGIRASRKGVDLGLEFDPTGLCGKDCSICKAKKNSEKNEEVPRKIMQE